MKCYILKTQFEINRRIAFNIINIEKKSIKLKRIIDY